MITRRQSLIGAAAAVLALGAGAAKADTVGVTDDSIKIGNTMPYSGPASAYGQIGHTIAKYFDMLNAEGGIGGRKIDFISLDDGYSPPKTVEQTRKLVEREEVAVMFHMLGTPTNTAVHKYLNAKKVPHLFISSGATKWGDPEHFPWSIGWQPNYQTEAAALATYVLENHPDAKIGILYQNDDFGKDNVIGFKNKLGDKVSQIVMEAPYETSDPTVDSQIIALKASGANVFYNVTTPKFAAQAIKKAHEIGWKPDAHVMSNVSASVGSVMRPAGLEASQGIIVAGYMMDPTDEEYKDHPEMLAWREFMNKWHPEGDQTSNLTVVGYIAAKMLEQALVQAGDDLSRENIMKEAANFKQVRIPMLLPGITLSTSPTDYFPIEAIRLQRFEGERYKGFGDLIDNESS